MSNLPLPHRLIAKLIFQIRLEGKSAGGVDMTTIHLPENIANQAVCFTRGVYEKGFGVARYEVAVTYAIWVDAMKLPGAMRFYDVFIQASEDEYDENEQVLIPIDMFLNIVDILEL